MTKKQKKTLKRIIIAAALMVVLALLFHFVPLAVVCAAGAVACALSGHWP